MDVNVIPVPEPVVHISGTSDISREYEDFKLGVRIFADVHIVMTTGSPTGNGKLAVRLCSGVRRRPSKLSRNLNQQVYFVLM